ncbi:MAG TPA: hemolysin family protein [Pirellulales bacterium]|nr:hemolysin family protein [Pirellulales bacterium]
MNRLFWIAILSLMTAGFASVGARSLRRFSRAKLEELCREERTVPLYSQIVQLRERTIAAADSLLALATAIASAAGIGWASASDAFSSDPAWIGAFGGAILGVVLLWATTVWIPIGVARLWADPLVLRTWSFWRGAAFALAPAVLAAYGISRLLQRLSGREPAHPTEESLEEEIRSIVSEGQREGLMEEDAREMIEGVIELGDVDVADVMTPRTDMVSLHIELPWDDAVRAVCQSGHTRIPVYNKSPDDIVGILHTKDLLVEMAKPDDDSRLGWPQLLRKPFFVPETKPVDDLLQEFQRSRNHIAVVLDEFGGVSGIVTIEDVLEEIVGEIADEHDEVLSDGIKAIDEFSAEALAKVRIHEINERLGLSLPEDEDFDTIGGFVFHEMGRIPNVGEELVWQDVRIKVLEATRRRIDRVSIRVMNKSQPAA